MNYSPCTDLRIIDWIWITNEFIAYMNFVNFLQQNKLVGYNIRDEGTEKTYGVCEKWKCTNTSTEIIVMS